MLDSVLVRLDPGGLERIEWRAGGVKPPVGSHLKLERKGEEWRVLDAPGSPFPADAEAVAALRNAWSPLQAERFAAYGKVDAAKYGLDKPAVTVTVYLHPSGEKGAPAKHTLELGGEVPGEKGACYARLDNGSGVAVLSPGQVQALSQNHLDFVNRTVLKLDAGAVNLLQRHMGPDVLELARKDDAWHLTKPADERADDRAMQELLDRLSSLRAQRIAAYPAKELDPYGLDRPAAVLTIKLTGGAKPAEHLIKVGKVADEATGARFAVVDSGPAVAVLPGPVVRRLVAAPLAFRDRALARFADADRIDLEQGPRRAVFARVAGSWKLVEPVKADAEQDKVEDFINTLARLRADELVAERPAAADLKKYGLDRPEARWRLQSSDKEVLSLAVGKQEKDGPRRYARLAGRDLVFLLDPRLSAQAVGELRPRTVWTTPLDAIQVEALRFDYVKNPFVLEKGEGDSWRVAGKPGVKVNAETVKETLAALANLQLARYAVDRDTDLKLFGLEPPVLTLEVATRFGKRVLQIGNPEGESKRRYARLADADRPGVFVLDEAAVANLFRDLAAFTRPPRTPPSPAAAGPRALP
jgi:hypothetical protein